MRILQPYLFASIALMVPTVRAAETFDDAMKRATSDYEEKSRKAADDLNAARKRIADEKAPFLLRMRTAEDRIVTAQSEIEEFQAAHDEVAEQRAKLLLELDGVRKNTAYVSTLARDSLKAFEEGLAPGEGQLLSDQITALDQKLDDTSSGSAGRAAMDVAEFLLERTQKELGGYSARGSSLIAGGNSVQKGTFAFVGPETYFLPLEGGGPGTARMREGSAYPITFELAEWGRGDAAAFFQGRQAVVEADASGGKALRLKETTGTILEHVQKGGVVAYAIIGVGLLSLFLIAQKVRDLSRLAVESPPKVRAFLAQVAAGEESAAKRALAGLGGPTRELFEVGMQNIDKPKSILEEHLQSVLLEQRLHFERRLPLLAVIATAAPLMGLLGTVVGMVKTFALITVFGTGNAGKLASGISQVLVATELGLVVAIPTLIAHGFLANRIQKNLSLLERYALDFVIAAETARYARRPERA
jgi:biopolymer transport protein ExbB